jgi:transcription initiation factor TFIIH subunit 2
VSEFDSTIDEHIKVLKSFEDFEGQPSLQNALEVALREFQRPKVPSYARKEILVIFSSLTNCDPSDIFQTITKLR